MPGDTLLFGVPQSNADDAFTSGETPVPSFEDYKFDMTVNDEHLAAFASGVHPEAVTDYRAQREGTLDLNEETTINPDQWSVPEADHDTTPQPAPEASAPEQALAASLTEQIAQISEQERVKRVLAFGPYVMDARAVAQHANPN